jgi:hypothetical protein
LVTTRTRIGAQGICGRRGGRANPQDSALACRFHFDEPVSPSRCRLDRKPSHLGDAMKARLVLICALALGTLAILPAGAGAYVYWVESFDRGIGRAGQNGTDADPGFIATGGGEYGYPAQVAVDGRHLYWATTSGAGIGRANLDGSGVDPSFIGGADGGYGVRWTASTSTGRARPPRRSSAPTSTAPGSSGT